MPEQREDQQQLGPAQRTEQAPGPIDRAREFGRQMLDVRPVWMQRREQAEQARIDEAGHPVEISQVISKLEEDPDFQKEDWHGKTQYRDELAEKTVQKLGLEGSDAHYTRESVKREFNNKYRPGAVRQTVDNLHDMAWSIPRIGATLSQVAWTGLGGLADRLDEAGIAIREHSPDGDDEVLRRISDYAERNHEVLQDWKAERTRGDNSDLYDWTLGGMPLGGGAGLGMRYLQTRAAPHLKQMMESTGATFTKSAASAGVGEAIIHTALEKEIEPRVMASDLPDETKQSILMMAPILLGLGVAMGPESVADGVIRNQAFTREASRLASEGIIPNKIALDPKAMRLLARTLEDDYPGVTARAVSQAEKAQNYQSSLRYDPKQRLMEQLKVKQTKTYMDAVDTFDMQTSARDALIRKMKYQHGEFGRLDIAGENTPGDRMALDGDNISDFVPFKTLERARAKANELGLTENEIHQLPDGAGWLIGRRTLGSEELEEFSRLARMNEDIDEAYDVIQRRGREEKRIGDAFKLKKKSDGSTVYKTRRSAERAMQREDVVDQADYLRVVEVEGGFEVQAIPWTDPRLFTWDSVPRVRDWIFRKGRAEDDLPETDFIERIHNKDHRTLEKLREYQAEAVRKIRPGNEFDPEHMELIREFDRFVSEVSQDAFDNQRYMAKWGTGYKDDLRRMVKEGYINNEQRKVMERIAGFLEGNPNFRVVGQSLHGSTVSKYSDLYNMIMLRNPAHSTHEFGHYAWHKILTHDERMKFLEDVWKNYNSEEAWNRLWSTRRLAQNKQLNGRGQLDQATEMFAEMFRHYVNAYRLAMPEQKTLFGHVSRAYKSLFRAFQTEDFFPQEMRSWMHRITRMPDVDELNPANMREMKDYFHRHYLHMDQTEFIYRVREGIDVPESEGYQRWLDNIIREGRDSISAMERSGAQLENILENAWFDIMRWKHMGGVDPVTIDRVMRRLQELFDPRNRMEVEDRIMAAGPQPVRARYAPGRGPDDVEQRVLGQREARQKAQEAEASDLLNKANVNLQYRALQQEANDLINLYTAYRALEDGNGVWPAVVRQAESILMSHRAERAAVRSAEGRQRMVEEERARMRQEMGLPEKARSRMWDDQDWIDPDSFLDENFLRVKDLDAMGIQIKAFPQIVSFSLGLRFDDETGVPIPGLGHVTWDPAQWMTRGGPILSIYSAGKYPIRRHGSRQMNNFWKKLEKNRPDIAELMTASWNRVAKNDLVRSFHPREMLTGKLADVHEKLRKEDVRLQMKISRKAAKINREFSPDEQKMISRLVERDGDVDTSLLNRKMLQEANDIKKMVSSMRHLISDALGVPLDNLQEGWLPRIYAREGRFRNWGNQWDLRAIKSEYSKINAQYLIPRGLGHKLKPGEAPTEVLREMSPGITRGHKVVDFGEGNSRTFVPKERSDVMEMLKNKGMRTRHEWVVERVGDDGITLRRDYSRSERKTLGEIEDVAPRLTKMARQVSKDVAFGRALQRIENIEGLTFDTKAFRNKVAREADQDPDLTVAQREAQLLNEGWFKLPDTEAVPGTGIKRYGNLAGKWVHPEVHYVLKTATAMHRPNNKYAKAAFRYWRPIMKAWKVAKTAYNPGTHGRNFTANLWMCAFQGRAPWRVVGEGAKHIWRQDDLFHRAVDAGMLDSNMMRGELDLSEFVDMARNPKLTDKNMSQSVDNMFLDYGRRVGKAIGKHAKWAATRPMRWYELGDEVFKMGIFAQEVAKGRSDLEAIAEAQRIFFDYRDVPTGVQATRDWGIVPFITYTYKVLPVLAKTMKEHPERIVAAIAAHEMLNDVMYRVEAEDAEHAEAMRTMDYDDRIMPDYMQHKIWQVGPTASALIGRDENEYGLEYANRYEYLMNMPGGDALSMRGILQGAPFGMNPLATIAFGMLENRDPSFDSAIAPYDEPLTDKQKRENADARMEFILRTLLPNVPLYPGSWSKDKLGNALAAHDLLPKDFANERGWTGKDYWGTPASLPAELVNFFGIGRVRRTYPEMEGIQQIEKLRASISSEQRKVERMARDHRTTDAEMERGIESVIDHAKAAGMEIERIGQMIADVYETRRKALERQEGSPE